MFGGLFGAAGNEPESDGVAGAATAVGAMTVSPNRQAVTNPNKTLDTRETPKSPVRLGSPSIMPHPSPAVCAAMRTSQQSGSLKLITFVPTPPSGS